MNAIKIKDFPIFMQPFVSSIYFMLVPIFANLAYIISAIWVSESFPLHILIFIIGQFFFPLGIILGYISIPLLIFTLLGV